MEERDKINSEQYIWLCEKDASSGKRFKITGAMDYEGGSSVCYYACTEGENSKTGVLKEFYPADYAHVLKREKDESSEAYNQLLASPEYDKKRYENFKRDLDECVRIHSQLQSAKICKMQLQSSAFLLCSFLYIYSANM